MEAVFWMAVTNLQGLLSLTKSKPVESQLLNGHRLWTELTLTWPLCSGAGTQVEQVIFQSHRGKLPPVCGVVKTLNWRPGRSGAFFLLDPAQRRCFSSRQYRCCCNYQTHCPSDAQQHNYSGSSTSRTGCITTSALGKSILAPSYSCFRS